MKPKTKIGVLGIGAIGGYFGGLLAEHYTGSDEIEIIFIAREATASILKKNGLKLILPDEEKIIFPNLVTSNSSKAGALDYLICCVKSYDLEESLLPIKSCIKDSTIILPLLNGVDARERIQNIYPDSEIIDGCAYIVSKIISPGVIEKTGAINSIYFGSDTIAPERLDMLLKIFLDAGIEAYKPENITQTIWEKFIFISCVASLTSYFNSTIGPIKEDEGKLKMLHHLIHEVIDIAKAKKISLPRDIFENTLCKIAKLPCEATSSLHRDFQKGGKTEYRSLTEYVSIEGKKLTIATPLFDKILVAFKEREQNLNP